MSLISNNCQPGIRPALPDYESNWALFLDVDGTLLELVARPDQVVVRPELFDLLNGLKTATHDALALISGRTISDLDQLFAPLKLAAAGLHGLERRDSTGRYHYHHTLDDKLDPLRARLRDFIEGHPGVMLEDKGVALAVHYREAPKAQAEIATLLDGAVPEEFHLQAGKMVYEIKPGGRDKGMAITEFMQEEPFRTRIPVFIGDDVTDEDGFTAVRRQGGHTIKVGDGNTAARWCLPDTGSVFDWLSAYVDYLAGRGLQ